MSKKFSYYLVGADGTVEGTDSSEVAAAARKDEETVVIHVATNTATFDSVEETIEAADPDDWLESDNARDGKGDDE